MTELMEAGGIEEGGIIRAMQYVCDDVPDKGQTLCVHSERCSLSSISYICCSDEAHNLPAVVVTSGSDTARQRSGVSRTSHDVGFEVVSKYEQRLEAKAEPLSVKMEGGAENGDALQRAPSVMTPRHAKENTGPYKTPAAKVAERHSGTPGFTPPSTG